MMLDVLYIQVMHGESGGQAWTPALVASVLIDEFRMLPEAPAEHLGGRLFLAIEARAGTRTRVLRIADRAARYVRVTPAAVDQDRLTALLTWARARGGDEPPSDRELCKEMGWRRETFYERKARALARVAEGLNRDGVPIPLLAKEAA
jgi:hypothetical protein